MKTILKYMLLLFISIILALGLLAVVSLIPREFIEKNVKESAQKLYEDGEYNYTDVLFKEIWFDKYYIMGHNSTDAIMINDVYSIDEQNIIESILKVRRNYIPGITSIIIEDKNGNLLYDQKEYPNGFNPTLELWKTVNQNDIKSYEYARYWHGYIVILRILLTFLNLTQIKILMTTILLLSFIILSYLIYKRNSICAIIFVMVFLSMNILSWGGLVQGIFVLIIAMIFSILIATKKVSNSNLNISLFLIGILTAYLDFLTTPIITFLLPIVILNLFEDEEFDLKKLIVRFIKNGIAWFSGYSIFWMSKWIITDMFYKTDIFKLSINQINFRTSYSGQYNSLYLKLSSLFINLFYSTNWINIVIFGISLSCLLLNKSKIESKELKNKKIIYCICALIPIYWYLIVSQHSYLHYHFTYKTSVIILLCLGFIAFDKERKNNAGNFNNK